MKIIKKITLGLSAFLVLVLCLTFTWVDRTDYRTTSYYQKMTEWLLKNRSVFQPQIDTTNLKVGWAKVNLTPDSPLATAGYGNRKGMPYKSIHDSIYVRALVFEKGAKYAVLSCDMLIIPPEVTLALKAKLSQIGYSWNTVFVGATHTHNSIGGWGKNAIGELFAGKYHPDVVEQIASKMIKAIQLAEQNTESAEVGFGIIEAKAFIFNRLVHGKGTVDPNIRILKIRKQSGKTALLCTYSAHATTLNADKLILSRDYPGVLVDKLEQNQADFAVFMAGSVGSTGPIGEEMPDDFKQLNTVAEGVYQKIASVQKNIFITKIDKINGITLPLYLREPQVRVSQNWRFRPWVFQTFFGDYPAEIKVFQIGNTVLLGTPCDYSGELMPEVLAEARHHQLNLIVTSFNGSYVGYITHDRHYDLNSYETRVMNWYGPQNGVYFQEIIKQTLKRPEVKQ